MAILLRTPEYAIARPGQTLVGWSLRLRVEGSDTVDFPDAEATGVPFQEQARPEAALSGMTALNAGIQTDPAKVSYYRVKNSYAEAGRRLEYAVTIVAGDPTQRTPSQLILQKGQKMLLGTLKIRGTNSGTARLTADSTEPIASRLVLLSDSGELSAVDLAAPEPLARVNVGPDAEKLRVEGQALSDVPAGVDSHLPFTRPFRIEIWSQNAVPTWRDGTDLPLATFNKVQPDNNGNFAVRDLPTEVILAGTYDLRATGDGTLSYLYQNLRIESYVHHSGNLPQVIRVTVGPFPSGDLDGDNRVDDNDLSRLKSSFGREIHETDAGPSADFNADGIVDGQDFSLMAANYGTRGG